MIKGFIIIFKGYFILIKFKSALCVYLASFRKNGYTNKWDLLG